MEMRNHPELNFTLKQETINRQTSLDVQLGPLKGEYFFYFLG